MPEFLRRLLYRITRPFFWAGAMLLASLAGRAQAPASAPIVNLPYWEWQNPLPTGYDLTAAHVFNDSTAIVVGGHGTALKTRDWGRTWQALDVGTTDRLTHVSFANALVGWVAVLTPPTDVYPISRPYAGIGEVRRTTDGGLTWTRQQIENSGTQIRTLKAISPTEAYVSYEELMCNNPGYSCGGYPTPRLRHTTDGGQSWALVNTAYPLLNFVTPGMAVAFREVQGHNIVLRTRDGGQTFRDITPVVQQNRSFGIPVFVDSLHGWVASSTLYFIYPPNLYRTQDGGRTWTAQNARADFLNPERAVDGLAFADSLHGVATLAGGAVLATADGGRTWQDGYDAATYQRASVSGQVWTTAGGHGYWNVGRAGLVNGSATDGRTWTTPTHNQSAGIDEYGGNALKQVLLLDATHGWAWGPRQLLRTASRGAQWDIFKPDSISGNPLTYSTVRAADFPDRDTGCVVVQSSTYNGIRSGLQAVVVRTTDGGQHWTPRLALPQVPQQPYGLYADQGGVQALRFGTARRAVLVGDSGTIFATQNAGLSWSRRASPTRHRLTDVAWAGPTGRTVYASGDSATLCRSDDGGQTWRLVRVDSASFMINANQFWPAAFPPDTPVRGIVFTSPEVGYMPYASGVAKTTNGGRTWANTTHLASRSSMRSNGQRNANFLNLYFRTPREGWYFGDDSFRTTDAGLTWTKMPELGDVLGGLINGGGTLADSYNAWMVGYNGRILHYSEKFIQAAPLATTAYAPGQTLALAFSTTNIPAANFRVQLSNRAGRFRRGEVQEVGQGPASPISVTLPATLPVGTAYRLRVVLADSSVLGADNGQDLRIGPLPDLVVSAPQSVTGDYNNVTITGPTTGGAGTATLTGPLTVAGTLTVHVGGTLLTNCQPLTGPGGFTLAAGATLGICAPAGISSVPNTGAVQVTGPRSFSPDASYLYNGTAPQTTGNALPATVRELQLNNPSGLALSQPLAVRQRVNLVAGDVDLTLGNPSLTLLSDADGTALIHNGRGRVLGATGTMQRHIETNPTATGYRHYSTPVAGETFATLATPGYLPDFNGAVAYNSSPTPGVVTPFPTVFAYDQDRIATTVSTYAAFDKGWVAPTSGTAPLEIGRGYSVHVPGAALVDFTGTFTTGLVTRSGLNRSAAGGGWHLLGNPYPSPLNWSLLASGPGNNLENLDEAVYVFQSSGPYAGTYRSYLNGFGDPVVPAGSGFFVRTTTPGIAGTLRLTNTARVTTFGPQPAFGRGTADLRPQLALALTNATGTLADAATLYAEAGATSGLDPAYDATKLPNATGLNLALLLPTGEAMAIDGRPAFTASTTIPLQLDVPIAGTYSLAASTLANLPTGLTAYLRDATTGQQVALSTQPVMTLTLPAGRSTRFSVVFGPAGVLATSQGLTAAQVLLYPNPSGKDALVQVALPVTAGTREVHATVVNALGQVVQTATLPVQAGQAHGTLHTSVLAPGMYMVSLQAGSFLASKRLIVQH